MFLNVLITKQEIMEVIQFTKPAKEQYQPKVSERKE